VVHHQGRIRAGFGQRSERKVLQHPFGDNQEALAREEGRRGLQQHAAKLPGGFGVGAIGLAHTHRARRGRFAIALAVARCQ